MKNSTRTGILMFALFETLLLVPGALAADKSDAPADSAQTQDAESGAEKVNVENIKSKYWARGNESEMGVVQNRTYTKDGKWELGVFGGVILTDPFLNVNNAGALLGYHFSEYFSVEGLYWKSFAGVSSAYTMLQAEGGQDNYNKPKAYYGSEAVGSFLYGKLSIFGKSIVYYDMHFLGGLGITQTENGNYITPHIGLGEQVYLSKSFSLRLDWRMMYYRENITQWQETVAQDRGTVVGTRSDWSNTITLGASFMFGGPNEKEGSK